MIELDAEMNKELETYADYIFNNVLIPYARRFLMLYREYVSFPLSFSMEQVEFFKPLDNINHTILDFCMRIEDFDFQQISLRKGCRLTVSDPRVIGHKKEYRIEYCHKVDAYRVIRYKKELVDILMKKVKMLNETALQIIQLKTDVNNWSVVPDMVEPEKYEHLGVSSEVSDCLKACEFHITRNELLPYLEVVGFLYGFDKFISISASHKRRGVKHLGSMVHIILSCTGFCDGLVHRLVYTNTSHEYGVEQSALIYHMNTVVENALTKSLAYLDASLKLETTDTGWIINKYN